MGSVSFLPRRRCSQSVARRRERLAIPSRVRPISPLAWLSAPPPSRPRASTSSAPAVGLPAVPVTLGAGGWSGRVGPESSTS